MNLFNGRVKKLEAIIYKRYKENNEWRKDEDNFLHAMGLTDEEINNCKNGDEALMAALDKGCIMCGISVKEKIKPD